MAPQIAPGHSGPSHESRDGVQGRLMPDLNRPLPPTPPLTAEHYEIPTLHRKPVAEPPESHSLKHHRSFSHPFPSFFGSKKSAEKKTAGRHNVNGSSNNVGGDHHDRWEDEPNLSKSSLSENAGQKPDRQPATGKCMTCDSTVRWPQGLKVYRCTTCLTINDLEPYIESRSEFNTNAPTGVPAPRRKRMSSPVDDSQC